MTNFYYYYAKKSAAGDFYYLKRKIYKKQASDAGFSRQCLEDKMSKGASNVDIGHFNITQPPERVQIWITWARMTNKNAKETIDNTYFL